MLLVSHIRDKHYVVVKYQLLVQYTSCFMIEWYWLFSMHATIFTEAYTLFTLHMYKPYQHSCKIIAREFLNHTGTPKQGSTITVASAHISVSSYTCNENCISIL